MRPLTEKEAQIFFEKCAKFIGDNINQLVKDDEYTLREHKLRVYYMRTEIANLCPTFAHKLLLSAGVCMGKFTKTGRFFLHITALQVLAPYAQSKVWIKPSAELGFLYGQHILKEGVKTMSEGTPKNAGVVVYNENDLPIGFGTALQSSVTMRNALPTIMAVARQGDLGEYLRSEMSIA